MTVRCWRFPARCVGEAFAAIVLCAVVLSACGSSGSGAPKQSVGPVVQPTIAPTHAQRAIPPESRIVDVPALRRSIAMTACRPSADGWAGSGTAKNADTTERTFHILVLFTDRYSRTIDYARTAVTVGGGKRAGWRAAARFDAPRGTQCVLRALSQS